MTENSRQERLGGLSPIRSGAGGTGWLKAALQNVRRGWSDLVFPAWCPVCAMPARGVCGACTARIAADGLVVEHVSVQGFDIPVYSSAQPEACRRVVSAFKDAEHFEVVSVLAAVLEDGITRAVGRHSAARIVPIPTTSRAFRRRGYWPLKHILIRCRFPVGVSIGLGSLEWVRPTHDQRGLDVRQRRENLEGALVCADRGIAGVPVVLVDDVVTTGATVRTAVAALLDAGASICGVAAISHVRQHAAD